MSRPTVEITPAAQNRCIAAAVMTVEAMAECVTLVRSGKFGDFPRSADCTPALRVAVKYGGDAVTAQAMHIRLVGLDMLMTADPGVRLAVRTLSATVVGAILAATQLTSDGTTLGFNGDALANALRAATTAVGTA